jgi:hypothetical protein
MQSIGVKRRVAVPRPLDSAQHTSCLTQSYKLWYNTYEGTYMQRKLTISIDARVYDALHAVIGRGRIGKFLEDLARPYVSGVELAAAYREMAADRERELQAGEWAEALIGDLTDAPR